MITNFKKYIHGEFFQVETNVDRIILTEEKGTNYQVQLNVSRSQNSFLLIHNLEELKQDYAKYLN